MVVPAFLLAFAGGATATPVDQAGVTGQREVNQQDPNTPPDCKKFPEDTRCQKR
jgi:hypothetical protein